jgi:ABC-2 type transport system ATP-binding protein
MTVGTRSRTGLPIEFTGITKHFGPVLAVDHLTFTVQPGRVTGFLGPNGSGKTTTLRMLLGLVHPSAGNATIGGRNYAALENPSSTVGAVLEATSFHPARRARTHLRMVARAGGHDDKRADEVLDLVGLTADAKRKVGGFSMGMRQRLELATALIGDPPVLILDEPSNGLDPQGIAWLRDFMRYLAGEGRTVLVSSHLLSEMAQTIDDAIIVSFGQLKAQGTLAEITAGMAGLVMRARTPEAERLCQVLTEGGIAFRRLSSEEVAMDGVRPEQVGPLLASNQIILYELLQEGGDLESVFLSLTTGLGFGGTTEQP